MTQPALYMGIWVLFKHFFPFLINLPHFFAIEILAIAVHSNDNIKGIKVANTVHSNDNIKGIKVANTEKKINLL